MIKLQHVMLLTQRLQAELNQLNSQEETALTLVNRWALFVTPTEIRSLVAELLAEGVELTAKEVEDINALKAPLYSHGVTIFPELSEKEDVPNG